MKKNYYVNEKAQNNGDHEVHEESCKYMPSLENRRYLGVFESCQDAVLAAKIYYKNTANGCYYCSNVCHTR